MVQVIDFRTDPSAYKHWRVEYKQDIATLLMNVDEQAGLFDGYELKLNSYDLGVDIELADVVQRLRFEHPEIKVVVLRSGKDNVFCAGANIRMLGGAPHHHKVNFCKFTNETRNTFEAAGTDSGQHYICAIKGACAGGGYELAVACNHIILADDGSSSVALPEVPLLAVLPGTGGLTRITDKRKMRRDLADVFCSLEEGVRGEKALAWGLVDELAANSEFDGIVDRCAQSIAATESHKDMAAGITLTPVERSFSDHGSITYSCVRVTVDRAARRATIDISGPLGKPPVSTDELHKAGAEYWMLRCARELDDALLHLRFNEIDLGILVFKTTGDLGLVIDHERFLLANRGYWLADEILLFWQRVLKRIDLTSRSLIALIEPGSCFAGTLAEILFAVDRTYMADGKFADDDRSEAAIVLTESNYGSYAMSNDLTRLQTRFFADSKKIDLLKTNTDVQLKARKAYDLGLVTFALDDIDWEDEIRIFLEERASFSPDALTGMEANLRFVGPETMETRIFGRLTAWQNWIFQRPNAVGEKGALQRYGSGIRGEFDKQRV